MSNRARRTLRKLDRSDRQPILEALDNLVENPLSGDIRKLQGKQNEWRLRVGPWRILFIPDPNNRTVFVRSVGDRHTIYRE